MKKGCEEFQVCFVEGRWFEGRALVLVCSAHGTKLTLFEVLVFRKSVSERYLWDEVRLYQGLGYRTPQEVVADVSVLV